MNSSKRALLRRHFPFDEQDPLYLIAIEVLHASTDSHNHLGRGDRLQVAVDHAAVAELDRVVCGLPKLLAHAAARDIVRPDLQRKSSRVEPFFAELQDVLADPHVYKFWGSPDLSAVNLERSALRD